MRCITLVMLLLFPMFLLSQSNGTSAGYNPPQALTLTTEQIIVGHASGFQDFNSTQQARNATIDRNAAGRYTVTFLTPHPDGAAYEVVFGQHEDANRDVPKVSIIEGTQTATGFDVIVTVDDNGTAADSYVDEPWSFWVGRYVTVLTNVTISN